MSDRPTPETDAEIMPIANGFGVWVHVVHADFARRLERQRDAYAYTLRVILQSAGQHVSDAIRHTHPELAP
jgi:nitrate reductase assembly molybdenum cofactor insertion protein NarJ